MKRILASIAIASIVLLPGLSKAETPGFLTGPCDYPAGKPLPGSGAVLHVPADFESIQAAVNAATEGDTVLIAAGTYSEAVVVKTPGLRIRGESRTGTIMDGRSTLGVGIKVTADRVAVENLTVHHYTNHGVQWEKVTGFYGRYITAYDEGAYGVFGFGSRCGEFTQVYASGSADSGIYIGECFPCDTVVHHIDSEENALGYSGTNAGGNLILRDSVWNNNGLGIVPNSLDSEEQPPQRGIIIGPGNLVAENNSRTAPAFGIQSYFYGGGIVIAGGQGNIIYGNQVLDNELAGVLLSPIPDQNAYFAAGNTIWGNTVTHDASKYPDSQDLVQGATSGPNNCWAHNTFATSAPVMIEDIWSCGPIIGTQATPPGGDPRAEYSLVSGVVTGEAGISERQPADWKTWPAPTCETHPFSCVQQPSDNDTASFDDDGAVDAWIPALGL